MQTATEPALALLQKEGFRWRHYVDLFDAGPTVECDLSDIRSVRKSGCHPVQGADPNRLQDAPLLIVSNRQYQDFRAVQTPGYFNQAQQLVISDDALHALNLSAGDSVRWIPLKESPCDRN